MRKIGFSIWLAAVAHSMPAYADWMPIGTATSNAIWYIDPLRVKDVSAKKQVWIKVDLSKDLSVTYRSSMRLYSIDCVISRYKSLSYANYDSYGKTVSSQSFPDYGSSIGYDNIFPDTMLESVQKLVCP